VFRIPTYTPESAPRVRRPLSPIPRPSWLPSSTWKHPTYALPTPAGEIAVTDTGTGPVLLFVHVGLWSMVWRDLLEELSPHYRCITLDAPGSGRSSDPGPRAISLMGAASAVGAVIDQLDLHALTLVLHDVGGPAGLAAAARRPERIAGLVALNTFGWRPSGAALGTMLTIMGSTLARESDAALGWLPRLAATRFGAGRHLTKADRKALRAGINRRARRNTHRYFADLLAADTLHHQVEIALRGPLTALPLMSIFGQRNDPFGFQSQWRDLFPTAQQEVITRGNHFPMCDDPARVAGLIRHWHTTHVAPALNSSITSHRAATDTER
jgi:pimeloyl-ACP methyl ester carboxylesterase